jgi:hypothetical protein
MMLVASALLAAMAGACRSKSHPGNSNAAAPSREDRPSEMPAAARSAGTPGFFMIGPTGSVSLHFTYPKDGTLIEGYSVGPVIMSTGYPIYMDSERKKGQHIHVILDNESYEADYDSWRAFNPPDGKFNNLKEGTHTLRAFPVREWHESIKQPDGAFDLVVFDVKRSTPGLNIDQKAPLLTYSCPTGEYKWEEDPRGILLDFYVTNATLSPNGYKVKYTLNGTKSVVLDRWEPVWWKYDELTPGDQKLRLELLDSNMKPVPFKVGEADYNRTERAFKVLAKGEHPSAAANANHH